MKLLSHLMKLLHLMILPSQQFCLCGILFNVHDILMKHALRLALEQLTRSLVPNFLQFDPFFEESSQLDPWKT